MSALPVLEGLDSHEFMADPSARFAEIHAADGPGAWQNAIESGLVLTGFDMLKTVAKHPVFQAQNRSGRLLGPGEGGSLQSLFDHHPVFMNEPEHMPVHRIAYQAVASTGAKSLTEKAHECCEALLDDLLVRDSFDLVADYCLPVAASIWSGLLGVPHKDSMALANQARSIGRMLAFNVTDADREQASQDAQQIWDRVLNASPEGAARTSTYTSTVESYEKLGYSDPAGEAAALLAAMTFDAIDGSAGMSANFLACVLSDTGAQEILRQNPGSISGAWVEATRVAPALLGLFRSPSEDIKVGGVEFEAGVNVLMLNAAGNQDPATYPDPSHYTAERRGQLPLTFGGGGRACVGRMLAKIQGEATMGALLSRTEWLELQGDRVDWGPPGLLRSPQTLRVEVNLTRTHS